MGRHCYRWKRATALGRTSPFRGHGGKVRYPCATVSFETPATPTLAVRRRRGERAVGAIGVGKPSRSRRHAPREVTAELAAPSAAVSMITAMRLGAGGTVL